MLGFAYAFRHERYVVSSRLTISTFNEEQLQLGRMQAKSAIH